MSTHRAGRHGDGLRPIDVLHLALLLSQLRQFSAECKLQFNVRRIFSLQEQDISCHPNTAEYNSLSVHPSAISFSIHRCQKAQLSHTVVQFNANENNNLFQLFVQFYLVLKQAVGWRELNWFKGTRSRRSLHNFWLFDGSTFIQVQQRFNRGCHHLQILIDLR